MRLLIGILVLVLLVMIDQTRYHGQYTSAASQVIKRSLSSIGL
jgi:hypothetical protein